MYTIFGNCMAMPSHGTESEDDNWGRHFDQKHHNNIRWYMNYEQSNLQIAIHVMLMSKADSINIVQLSPLHRTPFIDSISPRTVNTLTGSIAGACWSDTKPELGDNGLYIECTWQNKMDAMNLEEKPAYKEFNSDKDKEYIKAYRKRNYIAQAKWELHTAIAIIDTHSKASGHDIRIMPPRARDHEIDKLSFLNKLQIKEIQEIYNPNRIFWYKDQYTGKQIGTRYYPEKDLDEIINNHLQPWLNSSI